MENFNESYKKAVNFATQKHIKQERKCMPWPYIVHIYDVTQNLIENGASQAAIIAGVLHDTVEDTDTSIEEIAKEFGNEVAYLVDMVSENKELEYIERKKTQADRIKGAGKDVKMIKCADVCSNLKTLANELKAKVSDWNVFNANKANVQQSYKDMIDAISSETKETEMFKKVLEYYEYSFGEKLDFKTNNIIQFKAPENIIKCCKPVARVDGKKLEFCNKCKYFNAQYDAGTPWEDEKFYVFGCEKNKKVLSSNNLFKNKEQDIPQDCPYIEK